MSRCEDDQTGFATGMEFENKAAPPGPDYAAARGLKRELLEELKTGWREGQPVRTEELLARWPGNPGQGPDVASILFEEFCQRRKHSVSLTDRPSLEEFERRVPSQKDSLASLFRQHEVVRSLGGASGDSRLGLALPAVGDELFG